MSATSIKTLLQQAKAGDQQAWRELLADSEIQHYLWKVCWKQYRVPLWAQPEIINGTWIRFWKCLQTDATLCRISKHNLKIWLGRALVNEIRVHYRDGFLVIGQEKVHHGGSDYETKTTISHTHSNRQGDDPDETDFWGEMVFCAAGNQYDAADNAELLKFALAQLSPVEQQAIRDRFYSGLSSGQLPSARQVTCRRLRRALGKLQKIIAEQLAAGDEQDTPRMDKPTIRRIEKGVTKSRRYYRGVA